MSWPLVSFLEVCDIQGGTQPPKSTFVEEPLQGYIRLLQIQDFKRNDKAVFVPFSKTLKTCKTDDVLIARYGASLGQIHSGKEGAYNVALVKTIPVIDRLDKKYLLYYLKSDTFQSYLSSVGSRAAQAGFNKSDLENLRIPIPPLATQKHITRVLEQADQLRKQVKNMESELKLLAQSLFLEMFGDPVANPFNWKESTLGDSCWKITDGTHHSPPLISEGVPYITAKHLKEWGLDFFSDPTYVSQESHEQIYSRCAPEQGDVLYIKDGATTGIAALNEYSFPFSMLSSLALLKPDENLLLSTYLCHWLNSPKVKTVMLSNMAGAGITRLTLSKIKDARILLPPVEKQKQFELRLNEIHSFTSNAREQIRKCNDLFGVLMQRAFNGELTAPERKAA